MAAARPLSICILQSFPLESPPLNRTATVLFRQRSESKPAYESNDQSSGAKPSRNELRGVGVDGQTPADEYGGRYSFVRCRLELPVSPWGGGRGQRKTRAWRGLYQPFSKSSELHRGLSTPQLRAGGTRGGNGRYLSSSLCNLFITFIAKSLQHQAFQLEKGICKRLATTIE